MYSCVYTLVWVDTPFLVICADLFYVDTPPGAWRTAGGVYKAKVSGAHYGFGGGVRIILLMTV